MFKIVLFLMINQIYSVLPLYQSTSHLFVTLGFLLVWPTCHSSNAITSNRLLYLHIGKYSILERYCYNSGKTLPGKLYIKTLCYYHSPPTTLIGYEPFCISLTRFNDSQNANSLAVFFTRGLLNPGQEYSYI